MDINKVKREIAAYVLEEECINAEHNDGLRQNSRQPVQSWSLLHRVSTIEVRITYQSPWRQLNLAMGCRSRNPGIILFE